MWGPQYKDYSLLGCDTRQSERHVSTIASINTVDNGGSRHLAKMCITPYSHRILMATSWKAITLQTGCKDNMNEDCSETDHETGMWIKLAAEYVQFIVLILFMLNLLQLVPLSVLLTQTRKYCGINNSASTKSQKNDRCQTVST